MAAAGPAGQSVPAQVHQSAEGVFKAEFVPRVVGEHRVNVTVNGLPTAGSPYAAKVSQVTALILSRILLANLLTLFPGRSMMSAPSK